MILKRSKLFSKLSENTKDNISTIVGAGLGAGTGFSITKALNEKNLKNLGDHIEFKKLNREVVDILDKNGKIVGKANVSNLIPRGDKFKKVAKVIKSDRLAKISRNPVTKAVIIGSTALGVAAGYLAGR